MVMALVAGLALVSCGSKEKEPDPEDTKVKYNFTIRAYVDSDLLYQVSEYHTNFYPLYQEYKALIEEINKKFDVPYTVAFDATGMFIDAERETANKLALPVMRPKLEEAFKYLKEKADALKAKAESTLPSDYEKYTLRLNDGIKVSIVRSPDDIFEAEVESKKSDRILVFNADAYAMKQYYLQAYKNTTGDVLLSKEKTPNAYTAFTNAMLALTRDFDSKVSATKEGNGGDHEYVVMKTEKTPVEDVDNLAKIVFAKRIKVAEEWSKTAKNLYLSNFDKASVPQTEFDYLDFNVHVQTRIMTPFYICPVCGHKSTHSTEAHEGCTESKHDFEYINFGEPFDIDTFKKK